MQSTTFSLKIPLENKPIQIYWKFNLQNLNIFR